VTPQTAVAVALTNVRAVREDPAPRRPATGRDRHFLSLLRVLSDRYRPRPQGLYATPCYAWCKDDAQSWNGLMSAGADELDRGMQLPQRLARFNRHVTNPIQRTWAGWAPSFAIIEHVGRRSGKPYRTPVNAFTADVDGKPGVAVLLSYGPDRDWLKNLKAAGGGKMRRSGKTFSIADPRVLSREEAAQHVTRGRRIFARIPFEQAVLFTRTS
jgi:deazaflavin-dependent oxidoreductase (nitroreductase family)